MECLSSARGSHRGIRLVTRELPVGLVIEFTHHHRLNVVHCEIVTGLTRTPLVGAYLTPSTLEELPDLEEALQHFKDPIVLGYLNVDFNEARRLWSQCVSYLLVEYGLICLV